MSNIITLFSFGYWGWGNATRELVTAIDAVEKACGFAPPIFVDVRISRSVRAVGFRDDAFERVVGRERYRWMRGLGNLSVKTRRGPRIQIAEPAAAVELLDVAIDAARREQRVLFYCSCEWPYVESDDNSCHRTTVARLVRDAASERGLLFETIEWPGGDADATQLRVEPWLLRAVRRGRTSIPLTRALPRSELAGLPWGSVVHLRAADEKLCVLSGPARFSGGTWLLPVLERCEPKDAVAAGRDLRKELGLDGVRVRAAEPQRQLAEETIYTIAHVDKLAAAQTNGGRGTFSEKRSWTSGQKLLRRAQAEGLEVPIVFADATDCSKLIYVAVLTSIVLAGSTTYTFERLRPPRGRRRPQDLVLLSTGEPIAPGFIRPYALCHTPRFLMSGHT